jgi:hypothetical protein
MSTASVSVATDTPAEQPTLEEQAAAAGVSTEAPAEPLLGKFNSVDDLAKAYSELEKKLSSGGEAPEAPAKADADLSISKEEEDDAEAAGMDALLEAGTISQADYDVWKAGQDAQAASFNNEVFSAAGGEEAYNELIGWAAENLSEAEIDTFNDLLSSGNVSAVKLAVSGMAAQRGSNSPQEPSRNIAGGIAPEADVFQNWSQVQTAMSDPRYYRDAAYNAEVVAKIGRSNL